MQLVRAMEAEGYAIVQAPSSDPLGTLDRAVSFAALVPAQLELGMAHLDKVEKVLLGGVAQQQRNGRSSLEGSSLRSGWATE